MFYKNHDKILIFRKLFISFRKFVTCSVKLMKKNSNFFIVTRREAPEAMEFLLSSHFLQFLLNFFHSLVHLSLINHVLVGENTSPGACDFKFENVIHLKKFPYFWLKNSKGILSFRERNILPKLWEMQTWYQELAYSNKLVILCVISQRYAKLRLNFKQKGTVNSGSRK